MRISDWSSDVCSSDLPPRACRFFRREIRLNASPPDRMGQRPSAVEYSPPDDPGTDTEQATHQIGRRRVVRHEEATDDIAADRSGARHRAVDRGDLAMIGGRRSEEHTSELQSLMRTSYAVLCLKKKKTPL